MSVVNWTKPPPVFVVGGTEDFLRDRIVRKILLTSEKVKHEVVRAGTPGEAIDTLTMAATFGGSFLIVIDGKDATVELLREIKKAPVEGSCLLVVVDGALNEKKFRFLAEVHGADLLEYDRPADRKGKKEQAVKFVLSEAANLLKRKGAITEKLAEALVGAVGDDLGTLSYEVAKMAAHARFHGKEDIQIDCIRSLVRPSTEVDMGALRDALKDRDGPRVATALLRIQKSAGTDPVMLLLRGRGGPADLAMKWLRTALLVEKGATTQEIASRTGTPEWAVAKDLIPAAKRWGTVPLRRLVADLARVDRGILLGVPSPWTSCETALLLGCLG